MSDRTRNIVIVVVVLICTAGINVLALLAGSSTKDLTEVLSRRSPITDYNVAYSQATQCRESYRAIKDQHQAEFLRLALDRANEPPSVDVVSALRNEISADEQAFAHINDLCPYPVPPRFTDDGKLLDPAEIFPLTPPTTRPGG